MSVIGYDGKIRPKSVAVNVRPQGTMTPEQMERLHNERPDYVSGVMKIIDSVNRNVDATAGYFDRLHEEEQEVKHAERMSKDKELISKINDNNDIAPSDKQAMFENQAAWIDPNKVSLRERGRILREREQWLSAAQRAGAEQSSIEKRIKDARFATDATKQDMIFRTGFQPEMLNQIRAGLPDGAGGTRAVELKDLYNLVANRFDSTITEDYLKKLTPEQRAEFDRNREEKIAYHVQIAEKIYYDERKKEMKDNISTQSSNAARNAENLSEAMSVGHGVASQYKNELSRHEILSNTIATGIGYMNNNAAEAVKEYDRIISNATNIDTYNAKIKELGSAEAADKWVQEQIDEARKILNAAKEYLAKAPEEAAQKLYELYRDDLTEDEYSVAQGGFRDAADALIKNVDQELTSKTLGAKTAANNARNESGTTNFAAAKAFILGKSGKLPGECVGFVSLIKLDQNALDQSEAAANKAGFTKESRPEIRNQYFMSNFSGGLSEGERDEAYYNRATAIIASLDMTRDGDQNLYDIQNILDATGQLYGYNSDMFRRIAEFAHGNMQKEKNTMGSEAIRYANNAFLNGHSSSSKEGQELFEKNPSLAKSYRNVVTLLSEIPADGEAWYEQAKRITATAKQLEVFNNIGTAAAFVEGVDAAKKNVDEKPAAQVAASAAGSTAIVSEVDAEIEKWDEEAKLYAAEQLLEARESGRLQELANMYGSEERAVKEFLEFHEASVWREKLREKLPWYKRRFSSNYDLPLPERYKEHIRKYMIEQRSEEHEKNEELKRTQAELSRIEDELNKRGLVDEYRTSVRKKEPSRPYAPMVPGMYRPVPASAKISDKTRIAIGKEILKKDDDRKAAEKAISKQQKIVDAHNFKQKVAAYEKNEQKVPEYGESPDGRTKGPGWFGPIKMPNGADLTEWSVTTEVNGVEVSVPTVVPTLEKDELDLLVNAAQIGVENLNEEEKKSLNAITDKAIAWAHARWKEGKSPYIMNGEKPKKTPIYEEDEKNKRLTRKK